MRPPSSTSPLSPPFAASPSSPPLPAPSPAQAPRVSARASPDAITANLRVIILLLLESCIPKASADLRCYRRLWERRRQVSLLFYFGQGQARSTHCVQFCCGR